MNTSGYSATSAFFLGWHGTLALTTTRNDIEKVNIMTINAGVWIDHHKAVVLMITDEREDIRQIKSEGHPSAENKSHERKTAPTARGATIKNAPARKMVVAEDKLAPKVESYLDKYYDDVIACLQNADSIWILGPGKAKQELKKRIQGQQLKGHIARVETVDEMSDQEIAEHVRQLLCAGTK